MTTTNNKSKAKEENGKSTGSLRTMVVLMPPPSASSCEKQPEAAATTKLCVRTLLDPHSSQHRPYIMEHSNIQKGLSTGVDASRKQPRLLELQSLAAPPLPPSDTNKGSARPGSGYGSFLIVHHDTPGGKNENATTNNRDCVVGMDSRLYTATPVDPLFFVLAAAAIATTAAASSSASTTSPPKAKWQPWNQILQSEFEHETSEGSSNSTNTDTCVLKKQVAWMVHESILDSRQLQAHFYKKMKLSDDDDDDCFYQFSSDLALKWLEKKQQAVFQRILNRRQTERERKLQQQQQSSRNENKSDAPSSIVSPTPCKTAGGGAFAAGFSMPAVTPGSNHKPSDSSSSPTCSRDDQTDQPVALVSQGDDSQHQESNKQNGDSGSKDSADNTCSSSSTTTKDNTAIVVEDVERTAARQESIQIVCAYLNDAWNDAFCHYLQVEANDVLFPGSSRKRTIAAATATDAVSNTIVPACLSSSIDYYTTGSMDASSKSVSAKEAAAAVAKKTKSVASRKLEKVNIKGMQKMSSFFTAVKKKK